jgi:ribosomal protein L9
MKKIESDSREGQATQKKAAVDLSILISALPTSSIARKVGANEKLFGSVNLKNVLDELAAQIPDSAEALAAKSLSVEELYDCGGEKEEKVKISKTWEIRNAGQFRVVLHLHPEVPAASFRFDIVSE